MSTEPPLRYTRAVVSCDGSVVGWGDGDGDRRRVRGCAIADGVNETTRRSLGAVVGERDRSLVLRQHHGAVDRACHGGDAEGVVLCIGVVGEQGRGRDVDGASFCHGSRVVGGEGSVVGSGDGDGDRRRVSGSAVADGVGEAAGGGLRAVMGVGNLGFVLGQRHRAADCVTHGGDAERVVLGIGVVREQGRRRDVDGAAFCHGGRVVGGDGRVVG